MSNITQVVNVDKNLTTLKKGFIATGFNKTMSETGPFTIFAPSDKAFEKLDKQVLENLLKPENKTQLVDLLNHHIVAGKVAFKDLKDGELLKSLDGKELQVHVKEGEVSIDGARVKGEDLQTSNGVIYSLETVITRN